MKNIDLIMLILYIMSFSVTTFLNAFLKYWYKFWKKICDSNIFEEKRNQNVTILHIIVSIKYDWRIKYTYCNTLHLVFRVQERKKNTVSFFNKIRLSDNNNCIWSYPNFTNIWRIIAKSNIIHFGLPAYSTKILYSFSLIRHKL
jgi:hypothetical protein